MYRSRITMATVYSVVFQTVGSGFFGAYNSRSESMGIFSPHERRRSLSSMLLRRR